VLNVVQCKPEVERLRAGFSGHVSGIDRRLVSLMEVDEVCDSS
jgi:hypothetical protein